MKKVLLVVLLSFVAASILKIAVNFNMPNNTYIDRTTEVEKSNKLSYNFYSLGNNTKKKIDYKNQEDIKRAIFTGLYEGNDSISLTCSYDGCLNDFYDVYRDKSLMSSINNHVSPFNEYSSTKYDIIINGNSVRIDIYIDRKYTDNQIRDIDYQLDNYMKDLNDMTDYEKVKWAHDFLANKIEFDDDKNVDSYSAYGAIVGNKAVCQGYAEAMAIILDRFNIPNMMVSSDTHIWNLVYIDGQWLHVDVTWDDGDEILYDYFLITSSELSKLDVSSSHRFDLIYYLES